MAAHRYWRFRPRQTPGNNDLVMMNRIEAYDAEGSTDYMQTLTVTSSSPQDGSLANLLDNNDESYCQFHYDNCWVLLDAGAGNTIELDHYKFRGGGAGGYVGRSPGLVYIDVSDDGATFTTIAMWLNLDITGIDYHTLRTLSVADIVGPFDWWGIFITGTSRGLMSVAALQMFDDAASSTNLALGVSNPSAWDYYGSPYRPQYAFDNDGSTFWSSGSNGPGYLFAQLPADAVIEKIGVSARNDSFGASDAPLGGQVIYSNDGINWRVYWTYVFSGWSNGQTQTFNNPDPGTIGGGGGAPARRRAAVIVC